MADVASPGHKLGQMVGEFFERLLRSDVQHSAAKVGLYCDCKGPRAQVRAGRKVTWEDDKGNKHDLDYVLERGASEQKQGSPLAFIEFAWRRYTKHSVNKAGELANALVPLARTYPTCRFAGAILAGEFTDSAKTHLTSQGVRVLHISFGVIADAFASVGVDLRYPEDAGNEVKLAAISEWESLGEAQLAEVAQRVRGSIAEEYNAFMQDLEKVVCSGIEAVWVVPLYAQRLVFESVEDAMRALASYEHPENAPAEFVRFEVVVRYENGDRVEGRFAAKEDALAFLGRFA